MNFIGKTIFKTLFIVFLFIFIYSPLSAQVNEPTSGKALKNTNEWVRMTREEYIMKWRHLAIDNMEVYGIPASITMGQAILESGYGNSTLSILTNNHFNIKCKKEWTGERRLWSDDNPDDCFRVYESVEESYNDHGDYLSSRSWYEFLFAYEITDYQSWAKGLKQANYATDPQYAEKLIRVIEDTHIYLFDQENGMELYDSYLAEKLGVTPPATTTPAEEPTATEECGEEQAETTEATIAGSMSEHMMTAYADNGIDPNAYRVTINSHHGYSVYYTNNSHYVIAKAKDTYASIAKLFEMSESTIRKYNDVDSSTPLKAGDIVYVTRKSARWQGNDLLHKVTEGETLYMLSQIYGIRLNQLSKMNRIRPTDPLKVGQTIRLR